MDWTSYLNDQIKKTAADAVHISAQELTDSQKAQARENIGAGTDVVTGADPMTNTDIENAIRSANSVP